MIVRASILFTFLRFWYRREIIFRIIEIFQFIIHYLLLRIRSSKLVARFLNTFYVEPVVEAIMSKTFRLYCTFVATALIVATEHFDLLKFNASVTKMRAVKLRNCDSSLRYSKVR